MKLYIPCGKPLVVFDEFADPQSDMIDEVPFYICQASDCDCREVKAQNEEGIGQRRRISSDVGFSEQLLELVFAADIVLVLQDGAPQRFAEALRTQENRGFLPFQSVDIGRAVHKKAFADDL